MGDTLKKVKPGNPLKIPAARFNNLVDGASDFVAPSTSRLRSGLALVSAKHDHVIEVPK